MPLSPIDLSKIRTYSLQDRPSKVSTAGFAAPWTPGGRFADFLDSLPGLLAGTTLRKIIRSVADAARGGHTVAVGMGAHVIKVGLSPILIDLIQRGVITAVALNGAGIIHDLEVAMAGQTSEDVATALQDGSFGMVRDTTDFLNQAIAAAGSRGAGLGESVGRAICDSDLPNTDKSLLAACVRADIPVTVHVAIGTDILHMHPGFDPAAAGAASHLDFRRFAAMVATLEHGVYMNVGSAVVLPEVFLKAVSLARNLGHPLHRFTAVNLDFIQHYRSTANVVRRPTANGGTGLSLTGHHELLLPLIAAGVREALAQPPVTEAGG